VFNTRPNANRDFLNRMREYLPMDASIWQTSMNNDCLQKIDLDAINDNSFYIMDSEAMLAASHAIEDLAFDEANGQFIASFQDSKNFEPFREQFKHLALTIDDVWVLTAGKKPRFQRGLKFIDITKTDLASFWILIYKGRRARALVIGKQINETNVIPEKKFLTFLSFEPKIIDAFITDIVEIARDKVRKLNEFYRLHKIYQASKLIDEAIESERVALQKILKTWIINGNKWQCKRLENDLNNSFKNLGQLKNKLCEIFGHKK